MKVLGFSLLAAATFTAIGCTHDTYVYRHTTETYTPHRHYYHGGGGSGGSSLPGQPTHLAAPGAPETFRAVGSDR